MKSVIITKIIKKLKKYQKKINKNKIKLTLFFTFGSLVIRSDMSISSYKIYKFGTKNNKKNIAQKLKENEEFLNKITGKIG